MRVTSHSENNKGVSHHACHEKCGGEHKEEKLYFPGYLPLGYAKHGDPAVATGLLTREKLFLAVWNLEDGERTVTVPLGGVRPAAVTVGYPKAGGEAVGFSLDGGALTVRFPHGPMARLFEITLGSGV